MVGGMLSTSTDGKSLHEIPSSEPLADSFIKQLTLVLKIPWLRILGVLMKLPQLVTHRPITVSPREQLAQQV